MSGMADGRHADGPRADTERDSRAAYERLRAEFLQVRAEYALLSERDGTPAVVLRGLQERLAALRIRIHSWRTGP
jgi:hypothetical protein